MKKLLLFLLLFVVLVITSGGVISNVGRADRVVAGDVQYTKNQEIIFKKNIICEVGYKMQDSGQAGMTVGTVSPSGMTCEKFVIPAHAQLSGTGDDFTCDRDFKRVGDLCEKLILPANSHIAAGGNDFDCNTGYTKEGDKCIDAKKPDNAKFFPQSDDWYCENGYVKNGEKCEALKIPSNARASDTGTFFYCLPGHKLADNKKDCEQIKVPENAEPNWIGSWNCNIGFKKDGDKCIKIENVEHGKLLAENGFYCDERYTRDETNRRCVEIKLPENAYWDSSSYTQWSCNQGYVKKDERCEAFKLSEHGFWIGQNSWDCDAGYMKNINSLSCDKVSIPEHAYASNSYEKWDCDSGFVKNYREKRCDKSN